MKGATEVIIRSCVSYLNQSRNKVDLSDSIARTMKDAINKYENRCFRCIALAYKDISESDYENYIKNVNNKADIEESGFTLIGIAAIQDCLKVGIKEAVINCRKAGINVIMITGDNIDTAIAIAKDSNIIENNDFTALEGSQFFNQIED